MVFSFGVQVLDPGASGERGNSLLATKVPRLRTLMNKNFQDLLPLTAPRFSLVRQRIHKTGSLNLKQKCK